jgi:hypothetical protein
VAIRVHPRPLDCPHGQSGMPCNAQVGCAKVGFMALMRVPATARPGITVLAIVVAAIVGLMLALQPPVTRSVPRLVVPVRDKPADRPAPAQLTPVQPEIRNALPAQVQPQPNIQPGPATPPDSARPATGQQGPIMSVPPPSTDNVGTMPSRIATRDAGPGQTVCTAEKGCR